MLHIPTLAPALGQLLVLLEPVVRLGTMRDAGSESPACPFIVFPLCSQAMGLKSRCLGALGPR